MSFASMIDAEYNSIMAGYECRNNGSSSMDTYMMLSAMSSNNCFSSPTSSSYSSNDRTMGRIPYNVNDTTWTSPMYYAVRRW